MDNFFTNLNRFYNNNKIKIWIIIIAIILFLLVMHEMDKRAEKVGDSGTNNATISENAINTDTVYNVVNSIVADEKNNSSVEENDLNNDITKIEDSITSNKEAIEAFILLCNNKKVDLAYEMLSDNCKEVLYPTKQDFVDNYYSGIFKTYKNFQIISFKNNTYKVFYEEDAITTGNTDKNKITDYITVVDNYKLNLLGYIISEEMNGEGKNEYLDIEIVNRDVYLDYEVYTVKVQNLTQADIYIDSFTNSNMYIKSSSGNAFYLVNDEYNDGDFLVNHLGEKEIKLKFYRTYQEDNDIDSMNFESIKIVNRSYYEKNTAESNNANENSQEITYEEKFTNYPETVNLKITL